MKKDKTTSWSWNISPEELKEQTENYHTLKLTQTYRGVAVTILGSLLLLTLILSFFDIFEFQTLDILISLILYIPILIFVYKGHRWAMVALIILWTIEKGYTLYLSVDSGGGIWGSVIWWLIVTPYIYKAILVENARKKLIKKEVVTGGIFCRSCGASLTLDSKFCTSCGNKI